MKTQKINLPENFHPRIFKSRFTPNANGEEVGLNIGEKVRYKFMDGTIEEIIIDSDRMYHNKGGLGYEAIFNDGKRCFAVGKRIIWWDGKNKTLDKFYQ